MALVALILALTSYAGPPLQDRSDGDAAFSVAVRGKAGQTVRLRAVDVPAGYIASFCTRRVCSAFHVSFALPPSGRESIELQLIENVAGTPRPAAVTVAAQGARSVSIAFKRGLRTALSSGARSPRGRL
jgi:hypothetical protein